MSDTVTLTATAEHARSCIVNANVVVNGTPDPTTVVLWQSSDPAVATVEAIEGQPQSARVRAVVDPAGPSTRTAIISGLVTVGENGYQGQGTATVITLDAVTVTLDFGTPE